MPYNSAEFTGMTSCICSAVIVVSRELYTNHT